MSVAYHAGYVLDASVIAKWFTRHAEPDRLQALALRQRFLEGRFRLLVPDLCLVEVANALRFSPRAREEDVKEALAALRILDLEVHGADWDLIDRAIGVAWASKTTIYDALYVALAERTGHPLVTADDGLARSLRDHALILKLSEARFAEGD